MPLTRSQKEQHVSEVQENVAAATSVVFVAYSRLTMKEVNELRNRLYETGGAMRVVPKRLLKLALQSAAVDFDPTAHEGQFAVVWGNDAVAPAKVLNTFAQEHEDTIRLMAGILNGTILSIEEVTALAKLPSKQELLGQLVSVMAGPSRGLVTVLLGVQRSMVNVLTAVKNQKEAT